MAKPKKKPRYERDPHEFYIEPRWSVDLLFRHLPEISRHCSIVVDPACGRGNVVKAARDLRHEAHGFDLVRRWKRARLDRHNTDARLHVADFLGDGRDQIAEMFYSNAPSPVAIVCNPPYGRGKLAVAFIERALYLGPKWCAMLLPARFNHSDERLPLFNARPPTIELRLMSRPSMPPGLLYAAGGIEAEGGSQDYSWLCWNRDQQAGPTIVRRCGLLPGVRRSDMDTPLWVLERRLGLQQCRECGCTEYRACEGGCCWVERDLCSRCVPRLQRPTLSPGEVRRLMELQR